MSKVTKLTSLFRRHGARFAVGRGLQYVTQQLAAADNAGHGYAYTDYLRWMCSSVPGWLEPGNVAAMEYALPRLPDQSPMVEIGTFGGLSTCVLEYLRQKHGVKNPFFNCDRWDFEDQQLGRPLGDSKHVTHDEYKAFVRDSYLRNVRMYCREGLPSTVEAYSDTFFQWWQEKREVTDVFGHPARLGGPISFCYIDGNHTYEFSKRDFENTDRDLVPGGFILFDDSADGDGWDVARTVAEVRRLPAYRLVGKYPNYLFQKRA